ncbi:histone deacetylase family protein [Aestuariivirga sp.]|uniref:histone deacetylase family protein n=1 Tax=Aestuariivirga sp. TaxID=2650926 RepID=UPI0025C3AAA6|nr:histone deacetylase family protein [Aestuariivirga sp.]MCA3555869.1 histone deacetylase family protein [Aestuariivirga sp.]
MTTLLFTHPSSLRHVTPDGHPERVDRIKAINQILANDHFRDLARREAPLGRDEDILHAHAHEHLERIRAMAPAEGMEYLDPDTVMSVGSLEAALRAVGAATAGVDAVFQGEADNVFCALRPPGHHAETRRAMGFCLFNQAAIAALYARHKYGAGRVAVVDFDVHHGNGTQDIFWPDANLFYGSTHQMPLYPGTGGVQETGVGNIFNAPLRAGDGGAEFREAMSSVILPALDVFAPDLVIVSAGFDAHHRDPLGSLRLTEEDFAWATLKLMEAAEVHCDGRLVSVLEGGYDLRGLAASVGIHVQALMRGSAGMIDEPEFEDDGDEI